MLLGLSPCSLVTLEALSREEVAELLGTIVTLGTPPWSPALPATSPGWEFWKLSRAVAGRAPLLGLRL